MGILQPAQIFIEPKILTPTNFNHIFNSNMAAKNASNRIIYLDNLKVFLAILVISYHIGKGYETTNGFWPYTSSLHETLPWFHEIFGLNAVFFLGLFFIIAGYFFPSSFVRHGAHEFLRRKLVRFGIPLILTLCTIVPLQTYFCHIYSTQIGFQDYRQIDSSSLEFARNASAVSKRSLLNINEHYEQMLNAVTQNCQEQFYSYCKRELKDVKQDCAAQNQNEKSIFHNNSQYIGYWQYVVKIFLGIGGSHLQVKNSYSPEFNFGQFWFLEHLLVYTLLYVLFRILCATVKIKVPHKNNFHFRVPEFVAILAIILSITLLSSIIKIWYPKDHWVIMFGFLQVRSAHFSIYIVLFIAGIIASKNQWFQTINRKSGLILLVLGVAIMVTRYINPLPGTYLERVLHEWIIYGSLVAPFLTVGLIVLFRELFNTTGTIRKWLAENIYGAYIFHFPVTLAVQFSLDQVVIINALGKFVTVIILSTVITFILSSLVRAIPWVKRVL